MKKNTKVSIFLILLVIVTLIGITFGYFILKISGTSKPDSVTSGNLELFYEDNGKINMTNMMPGDTLSKTFSVENTGTDNVKYQVYLLDVKNTLNRSQDLLFTVECVSNKNISCNGLSENTFPVEDLKILENSISINEKQTYTINIYYVRSEDNQSEDFGKMFSSRINIKSLPNQ